MTDLKTRLEPRQLVAQQVGPGFAAMVPGMPINGES
jgi:hypothetical protein